MKNQKMTGNEILRDRWIEIPIHHPITGGDWGLNPNFLDAEKLATACHGEEE